MVLDRWLGAELAGYRIDALIGRGGVGVGVPGHASGAAVTGRERSPHW
jgi:hypothetical protein